MKNGMSLMMALASSALFATEIPLESRLQSEARGGNREASILTIGVNHLGWEPSAPKRCWVRNPPSETFAVETLTTNVKWQVYREGRFTPVKGLDGVWEADLSDLTEPGDYRILCGEPYVTQLWLHKGKTPYPGVASFHFPIRKGVYDLLERGILNFFKTQRCGHVKGWAGRCHQELSPVKDAAGKVVARIDARGGYHQSCDLRNWHDGLPISTYALIRYAELKKPVWDEGEIEAEIRWGLDHYLRVISPEGYVYDTQCTPIGWGPVDYYVAPATFGAQGNFAIVLARAAQFFKTRDAAYSAKLLAAAHGIYRQMKEHPAFARPQPSPAANLPRGAQPAETCYRQQYRTSVNGLSSLGMAALELYRADGSPALADEARAWGARMLALQVKDGERAGRYFLEPGSEELGLTDWSYCRAVSGYCLPLELFRTFGGEEYKAAALRTADWLLRSVRDDKKPYLSLKSCNRSARQAVYWSECAELFGRTDLAHWAQLAIDWLLGANPDSVSSVEGFGYNQYQRAVFGQFFPSTPQQTGAVGTSADGEYDLPAAAPFLWALARLTAAPSESLSPSASLSSHPAPFGASVSVPDGEVLRNRVSVSDTNRFTCGSGSVSCLSQDGMRIFAPYLASMTGFGECHDLTALADIPCAHPEMAASFDLLKVGDVFCGTTVTTTVSYASVLWKNRVRVMVDVNFNMFGYRDWDPETRKVSGEGLFRCRFAGRTERLSPEAISSYLTLMGLKGFDPFKECGDRCIWQSRPVWKDGVFYGFVTSSCSHPILFRCADGETLEFIGVVPTVAEYECQLAIHKGLCYAVMRGAKGDNFWTSADGGVTWKASGRVPDGLQRQQLLVWRDQVLIGYSAPDEKPNQIRNGRNNLHLLWGEGPDLSTYRELLHVVDPIGIVYPDLVDVNGDLRVLWSNSERFPTHVKWGAVQGKDQILLAKLEI